jgi:hypothetical protein
MPIAPEDIASRVFRGGFGGRKMMATPLPLAGEAGEGRG